MTAGAPAAAPDPRLPWYTNAEAPFRPGHGLGRKRSAVQPFRRLALPTLGSVTVNKRLDLPYQYIPYMDQGAEGSCVGWAWSWCMSILNRRKYAARKLYLEAQYRDPWAETPPEEGTSTAAAALVLKDQGHWRFARGITWPLALTEGIADFASASSVDDIRTAINHGTPVVLGVNWYSAFDAPEWLDRGPLGPRWWIGHTDSLGWVRGGHAICCFGVRDDLEAVVLVNSWGRDYPIVHVPYTTVARLLAEDGDAIVPVDRA